MVAGPVGNRDVSGWHTGSKVGTLTVPPAHGGARGGGVVSVLCDRGWAVAGGHRCRTVSDMSFSHPAICRPGPPPT